MMLVCTKTAFLLSICLGILISCSDENEIKVYRVAKNSHASDNSFPVQSPSENRQLPQTSRSSHNISWVTPSEWEELPAHGMRAGSFEVKKENDDLSLDISVIFLEGIAGGDLPNVNRWRDQIALPPWSLDELRQNQEVIKTPVGIAKIVDFSSQDKLFKKMGHMRIVAAIIPYQEGTWFIKMTGEKNFMNNHKPVFMQFLKTLQLPKKSHN